MEMSIEIDTEMNLEMSVGITIGTNNEISIKTDIEKSL